MRTLYLYGPPASGKSTLARKLSRDFGRLSVDLDEAIVQKTGMSIPEYFAKYGESAFRRVESEVLRTVDAPIVALGGGTLLDAENRRYAEERGFVAVIDVDAETIEGQVAKYLYAKADWASDTIVIDGKPRTYYPLTTLGKIYKDYKEISNVRWETGSGTDFTGSGAYTKETGLMYKEREIFAKNSATDGWFTKSGLSELPSSVHDNLFKIKVANEVDSNYTIDEQGEVTIDEDKDFGDKGFGRYINGRYYLTADKVSKSDAFPYLIFDSDSSSWVIVRVDEAVKASKIVQDADSKTSYNYLASLGLREGKENQNEIVWRITGLISGSDDYSKAARQEIIENANIVYHDQNVYDYFSTNFPDLFD